MHDICRPCGGFAICELSGPAICELSGPVILMGGERRSLLYSVHHHTLSSLLQRFYDKLYLHFQKLHFLSYPSPPTQHQFFDPDKGFYVWLEIQFLILRKFNKVDSTILFYSVLLLKV